MTSIVAQRVGVWWPQTVRGAREADVRSRFPDSFPLPSDRDADPLLHDVVMRARDGYRPVREPVGPFRGGTPPGWGLRWTERDGRLVVHRAPTHTAFPERWPRVLFTLEPGQTGVHRVNHRVTSLSHQSPWWYTDWTVWIGYRVRLPEWTRTHPAAEVDERVSPYGGGGRR
ncbi:hypothetical protein KIK06_06090 [Nocardiopsis sp. EMB25]|uniref:hypothetical protein n=1 Tax=Nocardiopsis sp. EMB25 TaxID=2835867 RepID=UPI002284127A|nr:hypothetical protein [Nocardiopsis sp. EMB25]MCY9783464.1 hypothetical protein [Nocardiopsis sp. EMB25]